MKMVEKTLNDQNAIVNDMEKNKRAHQIKLRES